MKTIRRVLSLLSKKYRLLFLPISLLLFVSALLSQVMPTTVGRLTDFVIGSDVTVDCFDSGFVIRLLLIILAASVLNEVCKVARRLMVEQVATSLEKTARLTAANALLRAPLSYFREHLIGNIHGRLNRNIDGTVRVVKLLFMDFVPSVCGGVAAVVIIFLKLPLFIALTSVLVVPIGTAIVLRQIKTQKGIRVELMGSKAEMDGTVVELLTGIETIRSLNTVNTEHTRLEKKTDFLRRKEMRHHKAMANYDFLKFVNEAVFNVLILGLSVYAAVRGVISVGTVLTAYLCFTQLTTPLRELHRILDELSEGLVLARDYFEIVEITPDESYLIDERKQSRQGDMNQSAPCQNDADDDLASANHTAANSPLTNNLAASEPLQKPLFQTTSNFDISDPNLTSAKIHASDISTFDISVRNLDFSYPEKPDVKVLNDFNLEIPEGSFIGLVGESGCGKSSFIKVLDRLEPAGAGIRIGGRALNTFSREELADLIALVPQTPFLISDTVRSNICYGYRGYQKAHMQSAEATFDKAISAVENCQNKTADRYSDTDTAFLAQIKDAAEKAGLTETIASFPEGFDHLIAEGGRNLSGGQRQRIALARIFLRKPKILILDEATSALDNQTEELIMKNILEMLKENHSTVISIAHRLSSLKDCDRIYMIENGSIEPLKKANSIELTRRDFC